MNAIHQRRIVYVILFIIGLALAAGLILYALKQNINVFLTPCAVRLPSAMTPLPSRNKSGSMP